MVARREGAAVGVVRNVGNGPERLKEIGID